MNLIPYNTVAGLAFRRPRPERAAAMALRLNQRGMLTKLRQSAGQDVEGGCGQLRARAIRVERSKHQPSPGLAARSEPLAVDARAAVGAPAASSCATAPTRAGSSR